MAVQAVTFRQDRPSTARQRDVVGTLRRGLRGLLVLVLVIAGAIETILVYRLWCQLMDRDVVHGVEGALFRLSSELVSPFASAEAATPIKERGIFDLSTLLAMEVYLLAAMLAVALIFVARLLLRFYVSIRRRRYRWLENDSWTAGT